MRFLILAAGASGFLLIVFMRGLLKDGFDDSKILATFAMGTNAVTLALAWGLDFEKAERIIGLVIGYSVGIIAACLLFFV